MAKRAKLVRTLTAGWQGRMGALIIVAYRRVLDRLGQLPLLVFCTFSGAALVLCLLSLRQIFHAIIIA